MIRIEPMTQDDVPEVSRVERRCFSNPWPASAYRRELRAPDQNAYLVLREWPDDAEAVGAAAGAGNGHNVHRASDGALLLPRLPRLPFGRRVETPPLPPIIGFAGMWIMFDEAHITTIGVEPEHRGRGFGELLLGALFDEALKRGAAWLTLEVRVSNESAQSLYRKYGFSVQGTRKHYYSDNNEDAYIMWSGPLRDPDYLNHVSNLRDLLSARLAADERQAAR